MNLLGKVWFENVTLFVLLAAGINEYLPENVSFEISLNVREEPFTKDGADVVSPTISRFSPSSDWTPYANRCGSLVAHPSRPLDNSLSREPWSSTTG